MKSDRGPPYVNCRFHSLEMSTEHTGRYEGHFQASVKEEAWDRREGSPGEPETRRSTFDEQVVPCVANMTPLSDQAQGHGWSWKENPERHYLCVGGLLIFV